MNVQPEPPEAAADEPGLERSAALDDAVGAVLETVPRAMRAIREEMRAGRPSGMSVAQFRVLMFVRRHARPGVSAVAEHLGVSVPAASQLVERLVRAGYVDRTQHVEERRRVELQLTESGAAVLTDRDERTRAWLATRLGDLDEQRLAVLAEALADLRRIADEPGG